MLKTSLTECLEMCLVDENALRDNPASRSSMKSFTLIFLAIFFGLPSLDLEQCSACYSNEKSQKDRELSGVLISGQRELNSGLYQMG